MQITKEIIPALLTLSIGIPMIFIFGSAMTDSETRRSEAPLRAIIGDPIFEALKRGEKTELHYLGNTLLAPDFTLKDQRGQSWKLSDHRGKLIVMNFWTITCQPCIEEMPTLEQLARIAQTRNNMEVITVSTDQGWKEAGAALSENTPLRVLFDPERKVVQEKYGTHLFPETWIVDARGVIRLRVDGARNWADPTSLAAIALFL